MKGQFIIGLSVLAWLNQAAMAFELKVSNVVRSSNDYVAVTVMNTVKDQQIVCVLYNSAGDAVASDTQYTDNLATKVLIHYEGNFSSARCAEN